MLGLVASMASGTGSHNVLGLHVHPSPDHSPLDHIQGLVKAQVSAVSLHNHAPQT